MRWSELENFTYGKLSSLRYIDLESDKYELLLKSRKSMVELSPSAKEKLEAMCADLMPPESPKHSFKTVGDGVAFIINVLRLIDLTPTAIKDVKSLIDSLLNVIQ